MNILERYIKTIVEQDVKSSIYDIDIRADNLEEELTKLVSNIDDLEDLTSELGYDVNNLISDLNKFKHKDDMYHYGETVMTHTREVLEELEKYIQDMGEDRKRILRLVAALHDVGKAVAYKWDEDRGVPTFHGHAEWSEKIARRMLLKYANEADDLYERIAELVKEHDAFIHLTDERESNKKPLRYLKSFVGKRIAKDDDLENLATIARADSAGSRDIKKDLVKIQNVLDDIPAYFEQEKEQERQEVARKQREQENIVKHKDIIVSLANDAVPNAGKLYPNISAINKMLGMNKQYAAIKSIRALLEK